MYICVTEKKNIIFFYIINMLIYISTDYTNIVEFSLVFL